MRKPIGFWRLLLSLLAVAFALISAILLSMTYSSARQGIEREIKNSFSQSNTIEQLVLKEKLSGLSKMLAVYSAHEHNVEALTCGGENKIQHSLDMLASHPSIKHLNILIMHCRQRDAWFKSGKLSAQLQISAAFKQNLHTMAARKQGSGQAWQVIALEQPGKPAQFALMTAEPLLLNGVNESAAKSMGSLYGGIILNENTSLLDELRDAAAAKAVAMVWRGEHIVARSHEEEVLPESLFLKAAELADKDEEEQKKNPVKKIDGQVVAYSPMTVGGENNDFLLITALKNQNLAELNEAYRENLVMMGMISVFASILITLLVRGIMSPSLDHVLDFVEVVTSSKTAVRFQPGRIREFNYLGLVLEQMVKQLAKNETYTTQLFQASNSPVMTWDPDFRISHMNKAAERLLGLYAGSGLGKPVLDLFSDESFYAEFIDAIRRATGGEHVEGLEVTLRQNGVEEARCVAWSMAPVVYGNEVIGVMAQGHDVTRHKQMEESLRETEQRFALFMDYLPAVAFIKDSNGMVLYVNRYAKDKFSAQQWVGKTALETFPEAIAQAMQEDDRKALEDGYHYIIQAVSDSDGNKRIYQTHKFAIARKDNTPLLGGIALDITDCRYEDKQTAEQQRNEKIPLVKTKPSL